MAKTSGLGDNFYVGQYDLSGDVGSLSKISGGNKPLEVTGINSYGFERIGGQRDGSMSFSTFFNTATGRAHPVLSALPTADTQLSYFRGATIGNPAASMNAKQLNYDGTRAADGGFTFKVDADANEYGLEWGNMVTPGLRTDTSATAGGVFNTGGALSNGGQLYLHVTAFSGTDITIKLQDATSSGGSYSDVTGGTFATVSAVGSQRIALSSSGTIRQYVKITTTTSGGFTSCTFAVNMVKNPVAVSF